MILKQGPIRSTTEREPSAPTGPQHHCKRWSQLPVLVLVLLFLACEIAAQPLDSPQPSRGLLIDSRIPYFEERSWPVPSRKEPGPWKLEKRGAAAETPAATEARATEAATASTVSTSPLPSPLDSSLSSAFTDVDGEKPCLTFIESFLEDPTFKECYPFSMLLQGSQSFFEAEKSIVSITKVIEASCAANVTACAPYMKELAQNLTDPAYCRTDYENGNTVVLEAYNAMLAYQTVYSASCLQDPDTGEYCYTTAIMNTTTPSNVYFFYLPLNQSLPGGATPSCNWCLNQTMAIYHSASADRGQPISSIYVAAAGQVDTMCGPNFANDTLPAAITVRASSAALMSASSGLLLTALLLILAEDWLT